MTEMTKGGMIFCKGIIGAIKRYRAFVASRIATSDRKMIAAQTKREIASRCRGSARFDVGAGTRQAYARVAMIGELTTTILYFFLILFFRSCLLQRTY